MKANMADVLVPGPSAFSIPMPEPKKSAEQLLVLQGKSGDSSDLNFVKLAELAGVPAHILPLATAQRGGVSGTAFSQRSMALALSAATLREAGGWSKLLAVLSALGLEQSPPSFIYGFDSQEGDAALLGELSDGSLTRARSLAPVGNRISAAPDQIEFCREFSGLTFDGKFDGTDCAFCLGQERSVAPVCLLRAGDAPFLVSLPGRSLRMLAGTGSIGDVDAPAVPGLRPNDWFSRLLQPLVFLRYAFRQRCWQAPARQGCFILDDPLLHKSYGFLEYDALLEAMEETNFSTSLAFIPWNFRRSQRTVADLFRRHPQRFSLSVHGCDHTKGEFGTSDREELRRRADVARGRMARHCQVTGVPFDEVMVFPQGIFSAGALHALKDSTYLAAVNSTPFSVDGPGQTLRIRDLLQPAVTSYAGFPLFIRHYPRDVAEFAMDLFLGKPALIVEHHDYFRSGYGPLREFTRSVNQLAPDIQWRGLGDIVRHAVLKRQNEQGEIEVRCFGREATIRNDEPVQRRFKVSPAIGSEAPFRRISPAQTAAEQRLNNGSGALELDLAPGEEVQLRLGEERRNGETVARLGSLDYRLKVFARRHLCEFRDNYVSRSNVLSSGVKLLKRVLPSS